MQGSLPTLSFAISQLLSFPSTTCKSLILRSSAPRPSSPDRKDKGKSTYKDFLGESKTGFILFVWQKIWRNLLADSLGYDQCGWVVGVVGKSQLCQLIGMKRVTLGQFTNFIPLGLFSTTWGRTMKEQLCHCFQSIQVNRLKLKQCFYRNWFLSLSTLINNWPAGSIIFRIPNWCDSRWHEK